MKNQNDMIISIVAIVLGIIGFCIGFFTKRVPDAPKSPESVILTPPALQGADVKMANSLPTGGASSGFPAAGRPSGGGGGGQNTAAPNSFGFGGRGGGGAPQGAGPSRE